MKPIIGNKYVLERGATCECTEILVDFQGQPRSAVFELRIVPPSYREVNPRFTLPLTYSGNLVRGARHYGLGKISRPRRPKIGLRVTKQIMRQCV